MDKHGCKSHSYIANSQLACTPFRGILISIKHRILAVMPAALISLGSQKNEGCACKLSVNFHMTPDCIMRSGLKKGVSLQTGSVPITVILR